MNNVIKLLCNYTNNFKLIDEEAINKIVSILCDSIKPLKNNLNDICFSSKYINNEAYWNGRVAHDFDDENNNIILDLNSILDYNDKKDINIIKELNSKETILYYNLVLFESLLHQIENLFQTLNHKDDIENKLVNISKYKSINNIKSTENVESYYNTYMNLFDNEYKNSAIFYKLTPKQRMANIKSSKVIYALSEKLINDHCILLKDLFKYRYLTNQLFGYYHSLYSPLQSFIEFKKVLQYDSGIKIISSDENYLLNHQNHNIEKRMLYGMELNTDEINNQYQKIYNTKTYHKKNRL